MRAGGSRSKAMATLFRGGSVLNPGLEDRVVEADVLVEDSRVAGVRSGLHAGDDFDVVDCEGLLLLPGFVQTHVHVCQTLWRNLSDDLPLMEWLRGWTWPMEAAHDADSMRASARLGFAELLLSGTTTVNDMGSVRHTDVIVEEARTMGIRGQFARVLMDDHDGPKALLDDPDAAVKESLALADHFHDPSAGTRIALAPRFAVSSSLRLLELVAAAAEDRNLMVHTHCAETKEEVRLTEGRFGMRPIALFQALGLMNENLLMAHCVHTSPTEHESIAVGGASVLHCPTTNLKLGSGTAPIMDMMKAGVRVSLGADGAACNNNLSMFREARTASLLQKGLHGPDCLPAWDVLRMATMDGATALGMGDEIGTIEAGKFADIVVLDPHRCCSVPFDDPAGAIVYSMGPSNVLHVMVGGRMVVRDGLLITADVEEVMTEAQEASLRLRKRAGL
ncbi:MAG: amidohydrolase family protein [Deltaproteobacteria bacterium]|nr:amidohydrolase family protein [Deltaproteobacteria bacterium]